MVRKFSRTLLKAGLASLENLVGCPSPGCENWLVLPDTDSRIKCSCELCKKDFCSLCKELYHYQSKYLMIKVAFHSQLTSHLRGNERIHCEMDEMDG